MTEHDKNDLKVPRFDNLNKALSLDTRNSKVGKTWLCCVLLWERIANKILKQPHLHLEPLVLVILLTIEEGRNNLGKSHDLEVFKLCLVQNDGWNADAKHVRFDLFASICFHAISNHYLE